MGKQKVVVGMSGGVDSSFAAAKLKEAGYEVVGVMLNLWTEPSQLGDNRCCSLDSQYQARRVAAQLDIPLYIIDAKDVFYHIVVEQFIKDYIDGKTPNPCINCNANVRWKLLLETARKFGIETVATGHYARIVNDGQKDVQLLKGLDAEKDQSYVLSMLKTEYLRTTMLPLGEFTKKQVRIRSGEIGLSSSMRPDSQDLCFLGEMDYRKFLLKYAGDSIQPGEIFDETGKIIGRHDGLPFYTIGQHKKLRIANNKPYYVISKNTTLNKLIVSNSQFQKNIEFRVKDMNWIIPMEIGTSTQCMAKIRYRSKEMPAIIQSLSPETTLVKIEGSCTPDVTPGQIAAFYLDELCMGGGIIV